MFEEVPRDESAYVGGGPATFAQPQGGVWRAGVHVIHLGPDGRYVKKCRAMSMRTCSDVPSPSEMR